MTNTQTQKHKFLGEILECTICLDIPVSPIYNCLNGHIICGICRDKVTRCGVCQAEIQVSILAERLVKQLDLKLKCVNQHSGCNLVIKSTDMKNHLQNCHYRDINCVITKQNGMACGSVVPFKLYAAHVDALHFFAINMSPHTCNLYITCGNEDYNYPPLVVQHDGVLFICYQWKSRMVLYSLVKVMGDVEMARKYRYKITLSVGKDEEKKVCKWECPVQPFHQKNCTSNAAVRLNDWQEQFVNYSLFMESEVKILNVKEAATESVEVTEEQKVKNRTMANLNARRLCPDCIDLILEQISVLCTTALVLFAAYCYL